MRVTLSPALLPFFENRNSKLTNSLLAGRQKSSTYLQINKTNPDSFLWNPISPDENMKIKKLLCNSVGFCFYSEVWLFIRMTAACFKALVALDWLFHSFFNPPLYSFPFLRRSEMVPHHHNHSRRCVFLQNRWNELGAPSTDSNSFSEPMTWNIRVEVGKWNEMKFHSRGR